MSDIDPQELDEKSDNEMPDVIQDIERMPSGETASPVAKNKKFKGKDLANVEDHINSTNNALDQFNEMEEGEGDDKPMILKGDQVADDDDDIDPELAAEASMPEELFVQQQEEYPESREVTEPDSQSELPQRLETDHSSPVKIEGDDADSGDNTEDLDPRSEFEKRKEENEKLTTKINIYLNEVDKLRQQLVNLESKEFTFYTAKKQNDDSTQDPAELKLEYQKALCNKVIITDKIAQKAKAYTETDTEIQTKYRENDRVAKGIHYYHLTLYLQCPWTKQ